MLYAYVDESIRGSAYLMCAVLVAPDDRNAVRRGLKELCLPGQERVHLKKERPARQRQILDRVASLPVRARIYSATGQRLPARSACTRAMVTDLATRQVTGLVIEPVDGLVTHDRAVIDRALRRLAGAAPIIIEHLPPKLEPLLWAADAIAWGYGAKGDSRRRVGFVVDAVVRLDKREARIMSVRTSSGLTS